MANKIPIFTNLDFKRRIVCSMNVKEMAQLSWNLYKPRVGDIIEFPPKNELELVKYPVCKQVVSDPRNRDQFITVDISDFLLKVIRNSSIDWLLIRRIKESPDILTKYVLWSISNHFVTSLCDADFAQFLCGRKIRITGYDGMFYNYDIIG